MDSLRKYYGTFILIAVIIVLLSIIKLTVVPVVSELIQCNSDITSAQTELEESQQRLKRVQERIQRAKNAIAHSPKKIYSPVESDLGKDTLFFALYNDIVEMIHVNSVKVKSIEYKYNPEKDAFVEFGKDVYFVCDVDMDLVSNYVNLGQLIQDIYQYPYYIKINSLEVIPYDKDKKILLSKLSLRLYAHTSADTFDIVSDSAGKSE